MATRPPTRLQEKLADAIIKDAKNPHPATGGELLEEVGYKKTTATRKPGETIKREGVKIALQKRGFTEQEADNVVGEILRDKRIKPEARLNAADKIYKRLGSYEDTRQGASKNTIFLPLLVKIIDERGTKDS